MTPILEVKMKLAQQQIRVIDSWLEGCIAYFLSENKNTKVNELLDQVKEQWSLGDLFDIGMPCLPQNIVSTVIHLRPNILNGRFILQMQYIIDISEPAYNQLEKLNNIVRQEIEKEVTEKSSRTLKMELTDGTSKVIAVELRPIHSLKTNLKPGIKIMLIGPIRIGINGNLFLENKNVRIIGGEVDCLLEENSQENVLLRSLELRENSAQLFSDQLVPKDSNPSLKKKDSVQTIRGRESLTRVASYEDLPVSFNKSPAPFTMDDDFILDDEILRDLEHNFMEVADNNEETGAQAANTSTIIAENDSIEDIFLDNDFDELLMQVDEKVLGVNVKETKNDILSDKKHLNQPKIKDLFASVSSNFHTSDMSKNRNHIIQEVPSLVARAKKGILDPDYPIKVNELPLAYIKQINIERHKMFIPKTFAVFAEITTVTDKLCFKKGAWKMGVTLADCSSSAISSEHEYSENVLNVAISSHILELLIGFSAEEMNRLSKQAHNNPDIRKDILDNVIKRSHQES